ncbi:MULTISPECIES: EstA family serine hydrolase [Streptomyces]|uniref:EstA family serine hydrolase n=2 Tax=Streptomyces caniscabiei TaxID=2746961 RepID=A0ABU4MKV3_9ACTN|nr:MULTISPECIES: EstA family serine hydrolase [Streptomyces]MBE4738668.1 EstA family serine hydrolase [Streptomyces caniscabiei]MBE4756535.1 EstA family serine hydrolase [Streptomyces caniscabiei]MBE4768960.1 EstA family serine hydrolase [Streptomyces caniscabiei]MBE4782906.1 EstA family serine hydrolase [Streptomyces caniscabiei]MBE4792209.1 EstA family serine hydrolase [Streptomyces caniscabiei]
MAMTEGTCTDRFSAVREALAASLDDKDVGASVAVYVDGEPEVDLWGGYADAERTVPWERDTLTHVWSTTKTMTALCVLMLADRGALDLHAPVATYWPEFAAAGKEDVRVSQVLAHTAGLPRFEAPTTLEDLYDWPTVTERLAAQAPAWKPGTEAGYHAMTQGYLLGEIVRRVTGRSLGTFFAEEVSGPLGADFHIGLPAEHDHRVAPVIMPPPSPTEDGPPPNPAIPDGATDTTAWRRAEIPAANGHGNARSVAAVQSLLSCGGAARGVRLLSEEGCARVFEEQFDGVDSVLRVPMRYGMGYGLNGGQLPNPRTCFWGGWGGSLVVVDLDARMTVAYMMNKMIDGGLGDERGFMILAAAYEGLSA